jgi:hypothetical protein
MKITIAKYDRRKEDLIVGFNLSDDYENSAYTEIALEISDTDGKTQEEVCQLAYEKNKTKIAKIKSSFEEKVESIIGKVFVPVEE